MLKFPDKTPTDNLTREFDWSAWLQTGDTISASVPPVLGVDRKDGIPIASGDLTVSGRLIGTAGTTVIFMVAGGQAGVTYEIACTIHTTASGETVTRYATQTVKAKL